MKYSFKNKVKELYEQSVIEGKMYDLLHNLGASIDMSLFELDSKFESSEPKGEIYRSAIANLQLFDRVFEPDSKVSALIDEMLIAVTKRKK